MATSTCRENDAQMRPQIGDAAQFWAERITDEQAAWAFRAIIAIAHGGAPHKAPPADMPARAADEILEQQTMMHRAYAGKVERIRANGRLGGEAKARALAKSRPVQENDVAKATKRAPALPIVAIATRNAAPRAWDIEQVAAPVERIMREQPADTEDGFDDSAAAPPAPAAAPAWGTCPARITDYSDIFDLHHDAALLACRIAGESPTAAAVGGFTNLVRGLGEMRFRAVLASFWGELRAGEHGSLDNPGAYLVTRLKQSMPKPRR